MSFVVDDAAHLCDHSCQSSADMRLKSALVAGMRMVSDNEAQEARDWLEGRGMAFVTGSDPATELTDAQILDQLKMYIAAVRIADTYACDVIGIQYQQGLKDLLPASDLVEGTLNNTDRPPVKSRDGLRVLYKGEPVILETDSDAAQAYDDAVARLLGDTRPMRFVHEKKGFFSKMFGG